MLIQVNATNALNRAEDEVVPEHTAIQVPDIIHLIIFFYKDALPLLSGVFHVL